MPDVAADTRSTLLAVRLRPGADTDALAAFVASMGLEVDGVDTLLGRLELAGLVEHPRHQEDRWRLSDDGRSEGERLLAAELDDLGLRRAVEDPYERFLPLNGTLLRVCTDWQLRDANPASLVVNDHSDAVYDRGVLARLGEVHERILPIVDALAAQLGRFGIYRPRFTDAIGRVRDGDVTAVDQPDADSYHAIWFELHDHLLATLGRDRASEPLPAG